MSIRTTLQNCSLVLVLGFISADVLADAGATAPIADQAANILQKCEIDGGLVVHVGCGDGRLTAQLAAGESYLVQGLARTQEEVDSARRHIRSMNAGGRVTVDRMPQRYLPYADNLVNLFVVEDLGGIPMQELVRTLAPGGKAFAYNLAGKLRQ